MHTDRDTFSAVDQHLRRRFYLSREDIVGSGPRRGWRFQCFEEGTDEPIRSTWAEWFFEAMRYAPSFASVPLIWKRYYTDETIDLSKLQPAFDGVKADNQHTPASLGLDGEE